MADVIIHGISHSSFGSLVTHATWGQLAGRGLPHAAQRWVSTLLFHKLALQPGGQGGLGFPGTRGHDGARLWGRGGVGMSRAAR